jgi:hypothetical protein
MNIETLLNNLSQQPENIAFNDVIDVIDEHYVFTPANFTNGDLKNEAGTNNGSCKIFAFGLLNNLNQEQTLACFGDYYREDVLKNPEGNDHGNIRNFMNTGWNGIKFESQALQEKS